MEAHTAAWHGLADREAEVAALEAAVARALAGDGGVLVVRGPAGIGKSALLRVGGRLAEAHGVRGLWAQAAPFERGFPFGVVRQLFEPVLARGGRAGADLFAGAAAGARAVLGDEPGPQVTPDPSFASLHALYWLTANLAARAPLLVCVDDVAWCDEASLRFLGFLVRRLDGMAVAVAVAYRTGEPGSSDASRRPGTGPPGRGGTAGAVECGGAGRDAGGRAGRGGGAPVRRRLPRGHRG